MKICFFEGFNSGVVFLNMIKKKKGVVQLTHTHTANQLKWHISTVQSIFEKIEILSTSDGRVMVEFQINLFQHDNISEYPEPEEVYDILRKQLENGDWINADSAGVLYYTISLECYTCSEFNIIDNPFAEPGTLLFIYFFL